MLFKRAGSKLPNKIKWLSLLLSHPRAGGSEDQLLSQQAAKRATAEAEGKLVQIGLEMVCWQTVIGSQNKRFGIADHNMQPMEHTAVWVVVLMLVGVVSQNWDIAAVTIAVDGTALLHGGIGEPLYRGLLDILVIRILRYCRFPCSSSESAMKIFVFSVPRSRLPPTFGPPKQASSSSTTPDRM